MRVMYGVDLAGLNSESVNGLQGPRKGSTQVLVLLKC